MALPTKGNIAGVESMLVWNLYNGYAIGTSPSGAFPANGSTLQAYKVPYPKTAQVPQPTRQATQFTGGNRWLGQQQWGVNEIGSFPITLSDLDSTLMALLTGGAVDTTTNSRWKRVSPNTNNPVLPQVGLMITTLDQSRDDDTDGDNSYINYIVPKCQIDINFPALSFQAEADVTLTVSPTRANKEPTGRLFSAGAMAQYQGKLVMYAIRTPKPLHITTHIGDGTATTYILGYRPASNIVTLNAAANEQAINGTLVAPTSVSTTTGVVTKAAAGSAADIAVTMYETDWVAI